MDLSIKNSARLLSEDGYQLDGVRLPGADHLAVRMAALLEDVRSLPEITEAGVRQVAEALNMMAIFHCDQKRPGHASSPYTNHPLLVAITLLGKFRMHTAPGVTTRSLVDSLTIAALHDVAEDQALKVIRLAGRMATGTAALDTREALSLLADHFRTVHGSVSVGKGLEALTNPDFDAIMRSYKESGNEPLQRQGMKLLKAVSVHCGALGAEAERMMHALERRETIEEKQLKNMLYLGHFIQIHQDSPEAFMVKLADFYANGLHFHLAAEEFMESGSNGPVLSAKGQKLMTKYGLVIRYLDQVLSESATSAAGPYLTGSPRGDTWYLGKVRFAIEYGFSCRS